MRYDLIRNNRVISHFDYNAINTKQLIWLHNAGYKFELAARQPSNKTLSLQAG